MFSKRLTRVPVRRNEKTVSRLLRYDLLNEVTREGIWEYDTETKESSYNENMGLLFGYTEQEMADNKTWWEKHLHPEDKQRVISEMTNLLNSSGNTWYGEYLFRHKNGTYIPVLERLYVVRDKNGKALRLVGTMQDLSPLKQLRDDINEERNRMRKSIIRSVYETEERERQMLSDELHENISQGLAALHLQMTLLRTKIPAEDAATLNRLEELLLQSVAGIRLLSNQLYPFGIEVFGIHSLITEQLEKLRQDAGTDYVVHIGSTMNQLSREKQALIFKIFIEHLKNIRLHGRAKQVSVRLEAYQNGIKFTITDNGAGADFHKIAYGGGFSRVHNITEAYNGTYSIVTEPGRGFTLEVIL